MAKIELPKPGQIVRVTNRGAAAGYRRAGHAHPKGAVDHPHDKFSAEQLEMLKGDGNLDVDIIDPPKGDKNVGVSNTKPPYSGNPGVPFLPPSDEEIEAANFNTLADMLMAAGLDPLPLKSKEERRAALREFIAANKANG